MFTVVDSFDALPIDSDNEAMFFCSRENNIFVNKNDVWVSYEEFVGGFEEVASITISEDVTMVDGVLFDVAPFFDDYKANYYYPICFSAKSFSAFNSPVFEANIVSSNEFELLSISSDKIMFPNTTIYYSILQDLKNSLPANEQETIKNKSYSEMFNVKVSNIKIEGPITLKLFKPVGV